MTNEEYKKFGLGMKLALLSAFFAVTAVTCYVLWNASPNYRLGGWGMWPITAVGLMFFVITFERVRYLFFAGYSDKEKVSAAVRRYLLAGRTDEAIAYCQKVNKPLTRIIATGLSNIDKTDVEVQEATDDAALYELPELEKRTSYLAMMGNVATLLGLFGTIVGLITSFAGVSIDTDYNAESIARAQSYVHLVEACRGLEGKAVVDCISNNKAAILSKGISEAMNCTALGLLVGIFCLLAFSTLNGRTQRLIDDISDTTVEMLNLAVRHRDIIRQSHQQTGT